MNTGDIELYIISLGYILDEDIARLDIQGNCAYVQIQVPEEFYYNITTITDAQVLGVFVWVYEFDIICVVRIVCVSSNNSHSKSLIFLICIRLDKLSGSDGNTTIDETEESGAEVGLSVPWKIGPVVSTTRPSTSMQPSLTPFQASSPSTMPSTDLLSQSSIPSMSEQPSFQPMDVSQAVSTIPSVEEPLPEPDSQATSQAFIEPTSQPSDVLNDDEILTPQPSSSPSTTVVSQDNVAPTVQPTATPSGRPTIQPSGRPTIQPSDQPTDQPTEDPSSQPTNPPSEQPSDRPTRRPSEVPTQGPSELPTSVPTDQPTEDPSVTPTSSPTAIPSVRPTEIPTYMVSFNDVSLTLFIQPM